VREVLDARVLRRCGLGAVERRLVEDGLQVLGERVHGALDLGGERIDGAGANRGVVEALERVDEGGSCGFAGHGLTPNSRRLLESDLMGYAIPIEELEVVTYTVPEEQSEPQEPQ